MSNESMIKNYGNIFVFANHDDEFSPAAANDKRLAGFSTTDIEGDLVDAFASGGAYQWNKADFTAARPALYIVEAVIELATVAVAGETIDFYMATSSHATAANGNSGNTTGVEGAWTEESALLGQLIRIGSLPMDDGAVLQSGYVGVYSPAMRFGNLVMINNTSDNIGTDAVESHVVFTPMVYYPGA